MNELHSEGNGKSGKAITCLGRLVLTRDLKNNLLVLVLVLVYESSKGSNAGPGWEVTNGVA